MISNTSNCNVNKLHKELIVMRKEYLKAIQEGRSDIFYNSWTWRKKRQEIKERDNFECQRCKRKGGVGKGDVVHHIKELKDYPKLGLNDDNLITVCHTCHNIIHERFEGKEVDSRIKIPERW